MSREEWDQTLASVEKQATDVRYRWPDASDCERQLANALVVLVAAIRCDKAAN